ncbi:hypothetical protein [Enterococcus sp. AZ196]|uniref:hypothetical protein n=1 Tax=Enterococcus sp. AZ196 TaxID=2774659 RepID=UPI003D28DBFA
MKILNVIRWGLSIGVTLLMWYFLTTVQIGSVYDGYFGIYDLVWLLPSFALLAGLQVIIHEAGHALFGKLTGYRMNSFRIYTLMWIWQSDGKIAFKQYFNASADGQCLMAPPDYSENEWPFRWYLSGGVLLNLLVSIFVLVAFDLSWVTLIFSCVGLDFAIINGIPAEHNDGKTLLLASQQKEYRYLLYLELKVNQLLNKGLVFTEMPRQYFEKIETGSMRTHLDDSHDLLRVSYFFDTEQWDKLELELESLWQQLDKVAPIYRTKVKAEFLFYLLIFHPDDPRIEEIWQDKKFRTILQLEDPIVPRLRAAFLYYREKNLSEALDTLKNGEKFFANSHTLGDQEREIQLAHWLGERMMKQGTLSDEIDTSQIVNKVDDLDKAEDRRSLIMFAILMIVLVAIAYFS